ncbi:hypothetical protein GCM10010492_55790 [Saccharothrix mutabilis subsp. mutabilis]|uniref:Uncharacterized protein n=1 Tax=Saccharothrix mutabilis subsp. mutabilis TaxID=66855 RepID=A0ABN0UFW3_9PSEU
MRTAVLAAVLLGVAAGGLTACGVTAQDEPQPLTTSPAGPAPTPTLTRRPDPSTTPSSTPSSAPPTTPGPAG